MSNILIRCDICECEWQTLRTDEIPELATYITCNWCPICEDEAEDYYEETHHFEDIEVFNPNQLVLTFDNQ